MFFILIIIYFPIYIPLRGSKASKKGDILEGFYIGVDHGHDHEAVIRKELFHG